MHSSSFHTWCHASVVACWVSRLSFSLHFAAHSFDRLVSVVVLLCSFFGQIASKQEKPIAFILFVHQSWVGGLSKLGRPRKSWSSGSCPIPCSDDDLYWTTSLHVALVLYLYQMWRTFLSLISVLPGEERARHRERKFAEASTYISVLQISVLRSFQFYPHANCWQCKMSIENCLGIQPQNHLLMAKFQWARSQKDSGAPCNESRKT